MDPLQYQPHNYIFSVLLLVSKDQEALSRGEIKKTVIFLFLFFYASLLKLPISSSSSVIWFNKNLRKSIYFVNKFLSY